MAVIMVVPGFSGSELFTPPTFFGVGPSIKVWLNYGLIASGGWKLLGLEADGVTPSTNLTGPLVPGLPLPDYYGQTTDWLTRNGWSVVGAKIDWRHTLAQSGLLIADQVANLAALQPVHVLAHSRGGLAMRAAFPVLASRGQLGLIGRCVGLGVPHQGSWEAAALLSSFQEWTALVRFLSGIQTLTIFDAFRAGDLRDTVISWPGAYQLLPAPFAGGVDPQQLQIIYDGPGWAAIKRNVAIPWLDAAHQAWPTLPNVPASVAWLDVVSEGFSTADQLLSATPPVSRFDFSYTTAGDGIVPSRWATQPDRPRVTVRCEHGAMPYNGDCLNAADGFFRAGQSSPRPSPASVPA